MSASEKTDAVRKRFQVLIHGPFGDRTFVNLGHIEEQFSRITVRQLKEEIHKTWPQYQDTRNVRLIFTDQSLDDDDEALSVYGIQHMSVIMMVLRVPGGGPLPPDRMGEKDGRNRSSERLADFLDEQSPFHRDKC